MTAFGQLPKISNDTVCYPRKDAIKLTERALQAAVYKQQRDSLIRDKETLTKLIDLKNIEIDNYRKSETLYKKTISSFEDQLKNMNDQRSILDQQITSLNKQIKKERRKKRWTAFLGIAGTAAGIALYIFK